MSVLDKNLQLWTSVDLSTEPAGTVNIGDIVDLGVGTHTLEGTPLYLHMTMGTSGDGGSGGTGVIQFRLVSDGTATIATDGTQTIHFVTQKFLGTELDQGDHLVFELPTSQQTAPYERFLALQFIQTVEGEDDLDAVNAWISPYPGGVWEATEDADN